MIRHEAIRVDRYTRVMCFLNKEWNQPPRDDDTVQK